MDNKDRREEETIKKEMGDGFNSLAKHEVMIKRMEEVKRDSIKIKLLEDILKELKIIKLELKAANSRNVDLDKAMEEGKKLLEKKIEPKENN